MELSELDGCLYCLIPTQKKRNPMKICSKKNTNFNDSLKICKTMMKCVVFAKRNKKTPPFILVDIDAPAMNVGLDTSFKKVKQVQNAFSVASK